MHKEEAEALALCADCGTAILPGSERAYAFGDGSVLCWDCAIVRGGTYDAEEDRWVRRPSTQGIHIDPP